MGKIVIEGQKMTLQYSSLRFYWSIGDLTWRTCWVVCRSLGRSLVSCQPSRCRCCCTMPKRSPAKRDFRDNGERKIKKSKESASSLTSKVDEDLVRIKSFAFWDLKSLKISGSHDGGCLRLHQVLSREFKVKSPPLTTSTPPPLPQPSRCLRGTLSLANGPQTLLNKFLYGSLGPTTYN